LPTCSQVQNSFRKVVENDDGGDEIVIVREDKFKEFAFDLYVGVIVSNAKKDVEVLALRSIVIKRRVEDLQLGVESYQKKLNLTKPDTYRTDLRQREAYTAYSNPRGFIYQNKDKKNRLMRIDELHKFSDGTLNDVRNALDDRLKGIRMQYLPSTIWRKGDKDRVAAMIQAIDKMLKTRRIMRSLEKFVGRRLRISFHVLIRQTIIKGVANIIERPVAKLVKFIDPHQSVFLVLILVDESSRV
nr:hypothetical protein [Tanacetum cinerariifolium]